jgi:hypothetical protein
MEALSGESTSITAETEIQPGQPPTEKENEKTSKDITDSVNTEASASDRGDGVTVSAAVPVKRRKLNLSQRSVTKTPKT